MEEGGVRIVIRMERVENRNVYGMAMEGKWEDIMGGYDWRTTHHCTTEMITDFTT